MQLISYFRYIFLLHINIYWYFSIECTNYFVENGFWNALKIVTIGKWWLTDKRVKVLSLIKMDKIFLPALIVICSGFLFVWARKALMLDEGLYKHFLHIIHTAALQFVLSFESSTTKFTHNHYYQWLVE